MMGSWNVNKVLDSKATGLLVFGITGIAKMASDYKDAYESRKNFVLLRDSLILGGSALGVCTYHAATAKVFNNKNVFNAIKTAGNFVFSPFKKTSLYKTKIKPVSDKYANLKKTIGSNSKKIIHDCANNTMMLTFGILGAVGADYGIQYSHIEKNKRLRELSQKDYSKMNQLYNYENALKNTFINSRFNKGFENAVGTDIKSNVYSRITDIPAMKMFSGTMVGVQGFEVIEEKTFKKRLKHATKCLIFNSLVPLFYLSTATCLTKKMNPVLRFPLTFGALVCGTMYTNKLIKAQEFRYKNKKKQRKNITPEKAEIKSDISTQEKTQNVQKIDKPDTDQNQNTQTDNSINNSTGKTQE